jgi:hypothetical protein
MSDSRLGFPDWNSHPVRSLPCGIAP